METTNAPVSMRRLGFASVILGLLGAAFFWWTPLGMVLSLSGLAAGFIGWISGRRRPGGVGLAVGGMVLCVLALILDGVVAGLGLEILKFGELR
jgi:hypothetical protein